MSNYSPRAGSTVALALQHLAAHGRTGELALASAIDKETFELRALLSWALKLGAIASDKVDGEWFYDVGDGVAREAPTPTPPPATRKAPAAAPAARASHLTRAAKAKAAPPRKAKPAPAPKLTATRRAQPPTSAVAPQPVAAPRPAHSPPVAVLPLTPSAEPTVSVALFNTGALLIEAGSQAPLRLSREQTRELVGYLLRIDHALMETTA